MGLDITRGAGSGQSVPATVRMVVLGSNAFSIGRRSRLCRSAMAPHVAATNSITLSTGILLIGF
jgi:hypothetical protein